MNTPPPDEKILEIVKAPSVQTSARHDASVLAAAQAAATQISAQRRSPRQSTWWIGLAASFLLGAGATYLLQHEPSALSGDKPMMLTMPISSVVRGGQGSATIPVEQADPDDWYRYIQELLYEGDRAAALAHLRRFNELHPDYAHQP